MKKMTIFLVLVITVVAVAVLSLSLPDTKLSWGILIAVAVIGSGYASFGGYFAKRKAA